jgi:hypothetical protein
MADHIQRTLLHNHRRAVSQKVLEETQITEETYRDIFREFWKPNEILSRAADRLRSSSLDISDEQPQSQSLVLQNIEQETGVDIPDMMRSLRLLTESLDEKIQRVTSLETDLEDTNKLISDYQERMTRFSESLGVIGEYIHDTLSGQTEFLSHLKEGFTKELVRRNVYPKLKEHEILVSQIRQIRPVIRSLVVHSRDNNGEGILNPICKICMDCPIGFTVDPCGHCYCEQCTARVVSDNRCFQCRQPIHKIIKLFT